MHWTRDDFTVANDRLDLDATVALLRTTHWAANRPRDVIEKSLRQSLNFALFHRERQVGFARVVTDRATVSYLCDVVIAAEFRRQGLGKWLLGCILDHPELRGTRMDLFTKDAHEFYRAFGFAPHKFTSLVRYPPEYAGGTR